MTTRRSPSLVLALTILLGSCTLTLGASPRYPGPPIDLGSLSGSIVFASSRDDPHPGHCSPECNYDIFAMRPDGSHVRELTSGSGAEIGPSVSPDGRLIAFAKIAPEPAEGLYVARSDGTHLRHFPLDGTIDDVPDWSPDGTHLVFQRVSNDDPNHPTSSLWTLDLKTGGVRQLTTTWPETPTAEYAPSWSRSGRIVFTRSSVPTGVTNQICWVEVGSAATGCFGGPGNYGYPQWSPDGTRIAYSGFVGDDWDIYVMDADGSDVRRLTDGPTDDTLPTWSPDGSHLTFMTTSESSWRIAVMRSDGTGRTLLPGVDDGAPYWGSGD